MKAKSDRPIRACMCAGCRQHPYGEAAKEHAAINRVLAGLDEKSRRRFVGVLAAQWGRGGMELLAAITGMSRPTIRRGRDEVWKVERAKARQRVRGSGGGRKGVEKNIRGS